MVLHLLLLLLSKMENARIFGDAKCLRRWEDERTLEQGVLTEIFSRRQAERRFLVLAKFGDSSGVFPCDESSLNLHYLRGIFVPCFLRCFLILCFALSCDWAVASLSCKSTKQLLFYFCWLLFTWLHSCTLSPHWAFFSPLPLFNE